MRIGYRNPYTVRVTPGYAKVMLYCLKANLIFLYLNDSFSIFIPSYWTDLI